MIIEAMTSLKLNDIEYCFLVGDQPSSNTEFRVRNPKLTPFIQGNMTGILNHVFNSSIFNNASQCKPTVDRKISTQNFITIKKSNNCSLEHLAVNGYIPHNTRVRCICNNNNINDMIIIDG